MKQLGEGRREAINGLQALLGPATPRPLAEHTFAYLLDKGLIIQEAETFSIDSSMDTDHLRKTAKSVQSARHFTITKQHFAKARVGSTWRARTAAQASIFSPSLQSSEGYQDGSGDDQTSED